MRRPKRRSPVSAVTEEGSDRAALSGDRAGAGIDVDQRPQLRIVGVDILGAAVRQIDEHRAGVRLIAQYAAGGVLAVEPGGAERRGELALVHALDLADRDRPAGIGRAK